MSEKWICAVVAPNASAAVPTKATVGLAAS